MGSQPRITEVEKKGTRDEAQRKNAVQVLFYKATRMPTVAARVTQTEYAVSQEPALRACGIVPEER